jgi:hypothetical protein
VAGRVSILQRVAPHIHHAVVIPHIRGVGHKRIGRDEQPHGAVIVPRPVVHQPGAVQLLAGVAVVGGT